MKKKYDDWANKRTIPNLELYTKLIGIYYSSIATNYLFAFFYGKYVLHTEIAGVLLAFSLLMFLMTPIAMTDPQKGNRDLTKVVLSGFMHGMCTIIIAVAIKFWILLLLYVLEVLIVMIVIILYFKPRRKKRRKK